MAGSIPESIGDLLNLVQLHISYAGISGFLLKITLNTLLKEVIILSYRPYTSEYWEVEAAPSHRPQRESDYRCVRVLSSAIFFY